MTKQPRHVRGVVLNDPFEALPRVLAGVHDAWSKMRFHGDGIADGHGDGVRPRHMVRSRKTRTHPGSVGRDGVRFGVRMQLNTAEELEEDGDDDAYEHQNMCHQR